MMWIKLWANAEWLEQTGQCSLEIREGHEIIQYEKLSVSLQLLTLLSVVAGR